MMEPVSYVGESNYHRLGNKLKGETTAARMRRVRQRNPAHVPTLDAKPSQLGGVGDYLSLSLEHLKSGGNFVADMLGGAAYGASIGAVAGLATSKNPGRLASAIDPISSIEEVNDLTRAVRGKGKYAGKSRGARFTEATADTLLGATSLVIYGGIPAFTTTGVIDFSKNSSDDYKGIPHLGAISKDQGLLMASGLVGGAVGVGLIALGAKLQEKDWLTAVGTGAGYLTVAGLSAAIIPEAAAFWRGFGGVVGGGFGYAMAQEATTAREILGVD